MRTGLPRKRNFEERVMPLFATRSFTMTRLDWLSTKAIKLSLPPSMHLAIGTTCWLPPIARQALLLNATLSASGNARCSEQSLGTLFGGWHFLLHGAQIPCCHWLVRCTNHETSAQCPFSLMRFKTLVVRTPTFSITAAGRDRTFAGAGSSI